MCQPHGTEVFTQEDSDPILTQGNLTPTPTHPVTQASKPFGSPLTPAQVTRFCITTIQKQAKECKDNKHTNAASKTVTFVVWSGTNVSHKFYLSILQNHMDLYFYFSMILGQPLGM
jgi:hypothetical protein